jgi:hypothetical protein
MPLRLGLATLIIPIAGCVMGVRGARDSLGSRAAFDMQCPEERLEMTEFSENSYGISGCGRRASYVWNGSSWVLNSAVQQR